MQPAKRLEGIELSLIRQINALATPLSTNLGIGEPNVVPDEALRAKAAKAASGPWQYSPNAGSLSLRKRIAGESFDPQTEVCITAGTQEGLFSLFQAYLGPGDEILIPNPGFLAYATIARMCGATPVAYELEPPDWTIDISAVVKRITRHTKAIVVNSPSNPLGAVMGDDALDAIAAMAEERDILAISDEVYSEIWYERPAPSMRGRGRNAVVLNGLSKSHSMTGLRLGWILASAAILRPVITAHQYIATCASVFSQRLAELILEDEAWNQAWLGGVRAQMSAQREAAMHAIQRELDVSIPPPAGAFYAFVPVPSCDTVSFAKTLATDAAVLVIPGVAFGGRGEGFVRISFAASLEQIGTGIERIGRYLRSIGR